MLCPPMILRFEKIQENQQQQVGLQASQLALLKQKGLPVVDGFVLTAEAFNLFLEENLLNDKIGSILQRINFDIEEDVKGAAEEIEHLIVGGVISETMKEHLEAAYETLTVNGGFSLRDREPFVILKLSTQYSQKSLYDQIVNIQGIEKLIEAIKYLWARFYTPEQLIFRQEKSYHHQQPIGVIVQYMMDADQSTVASTIPESNTITLSSLLGIGKMIDDTAHADEYLINKNMLEVESEKRKHQEYKIRRDKTDRIMKEFIRNIGHERVFNDKEAIDIARLCKKIEKILAAECQSIILTKQESHYIFSVLGAKETDAEFKDANKLSTASSDVEEQKEKFDLDQDLAILDEIESEQPDHDTEKAMNIFPEEPADDLLEKEPESLAFEIDHVHHEQTQPIEQESTADSILDEILREEDPVDDLSDTRIAEIVDGMNEDIVPQNVEEEVDELSATQLALLERWLGLVRKKLLILYKTHYVEDFQDTTERLLDEVSKFYKIEHKNDLKKVIELIKTKDERLHDPGILAFSLETLRRMLES